MKKMIFVFVSFLFSLGIYGQTIRYLGVDFAKLPGYTPNINYRIDKHPGLSYEIEAGVTFNYKQSYDIGDLFSHHWDDSDADSHTDNVSGSYLKLGVLLRNKKKLYKKNYFQYGISLINSFIHETGRDFTFSDIEGEDEVYPYTQNYYKMGIGIYCGYNLKLTKRIYSNIGMQTSYSLFGTKDGKWDYEYIPGMGINTSNVNFRFMPALKLSYQFK